MIPPFRDRADAGRRLAKRLMGYKTRLPVVLALPRGGVAVAHPVAVALGAPLDVVLVRKIGTPLQPELAAGAVAEGDPPELVINDEIGGAISPAWFKAEAERQIKEIARRRGRYLGTRARAAIAGRTAIVIDDGIATGATMRAALRAVRKAQPARMVLAVPVAPPGVIARLRDEVDEVICLTISELFGAVGQYYKSFPQLDDAEVVALLDDAASRFSP